MFPSDYIAKLKQIEVNHQSELEQVLNEATADPEIPLGDMQDIIKAAARQGWYNPAYTTALKEQNNIE